MPAAINEQNKLTKCSRNITVHLLNSSFSLLHEKNLNYPLKMQNVCLQTLNANVDRTCLDVATIKTEMIPQSEQLDVEKLRGKHQLA